MKRLIILVLFAVIGQAYGQYLDIDPPDSSVKSTYEYVCIYRIWDRIQMQQGDGIYFMYSWVTNLQAFQSKEELIIWMNESDWNEHPKSRLSENEIIGIYKLDKPIEWIIKHEKKSKPKEVVIEADEWEESKFELEE